VVLRGEQLLMSEVPFYRELPMHESEEPPQYYLTRFFVDLQKSTPPQIRQLILRISYSKG
jgi:hypothetical protein